MFHSNLKDITNELEFMAKAVDPAQASKRLFLPQVQGAVFYQGCEDPCYESGKQKTEASAAVKCNASCNERVQYTRIRQNKF
jgi:hypothetical protein